MSPPEFPGQIPLIREVLGAMGVQIVTAEGYEADDVICTLTKQARAAGHDVLVVSGDRDAFQLVDEHVTVLYPVRGVSELTRMTPDAVVARYGVPPERYPDLAALVGETSDNLPGVPGVGPKTAAKWITQYDGLAGVVAHADAIKGKAGESFREHIGDVERNRRLNRLVDDLDLGRRGRGAPAAAVGPRRHPHRLRRPGVPGPARAAVRDPRQRRARGDRRLLRSRCARPRGEEVAAWTAPVPPGPGSGPRSSSPPTSPAPARRRGPPRWRGSRSPPPTARSRSSASATCCAWVASPDGPALVLHDAKPQLHALARAAWARGLGQVAADAADDDPTTTGQGGAGPRPGARRPVSEDGTTGRARAWPAPSPGCPRGTPRSRPTCAGPTSAPTTSPTCPCGTWAARWSRPSPSSRGSRSRSS